MNSILPLLFHSQVFTDRRIRERGGGSVNHFVGFSFLLHLWERGRRGWMGDLIWNGLEEGRQH